MSVETGTRHVDSAIIHVGFPKAGSKSIQEFLHQRHASLVSAGFFYPRLWDILGDDRRLWPDQSRDDRLVGHMLLVSELRGWTRELPPAMQHFLAERSLTARIADAFAASGCERIVLSSEGFCMVLRRDTEPLPPELLGPRPEIVALIRRKDEWLLSRYKQNIKDHRRATATLEGFLQQLRPGGIDYVKMTGNLERYFSTGRLSLIDFDRHRADIFAPFRAAAGLPDIRSPNPHDAEDSKDATYANLSLSNLASLFLIECNRSSMPEPARLAVRDALFLVEAELAAEFGKVELLPVEVRRAAVAHHNADIAEINRRFGSDLGAIDEADARAPREVRSSTTHRERQRIAEILAPHIDDETRDALGRAMAERAAA